MKKLTTSEMNRLTVEQFHQADKIPLIAVLDNVRSRHNIGAVFRTADAFLLQGVYLCGICCCPPDKELHKTALGAEMTVDWQHFDNTLDAVHTLHQDGYTVYAIEQAHDSINFDTIHVSGKVAVVFGHEVFGVSQEVVDACDGCIEITQYGTKHSLNVSVTAGIVLHRLSVQLNEGLKK